MKFGSTVTHARRRVARTPFRRTQARVVVTGVGDAFADAVVGRPIRSLTMVTPWATDGFGGCESFDRLLTWATSSRAQVRLLTREPLGNEPHRRAIRAVLDAGGLVTTNAALHAKIFVAEHADGRRVALVGSANLTFGSDSLLETALLVISGPRRRGPDIVDDLLNGPVLRFWRHPDSRRVRSI